MLASLALTLVALAPAVVSAPPARASGRIQLSDDRAVSRAAGCEDSRTTSCESIHSLVEVRIGSGVIGVALEEGTLTWRTATNSNTYTAEIDVVTTRMSPTAAGMFDQITATCGSPCSSSGIVSGPVILGYHIKGAIHFTNTTRTVDTSRALFIFTGEMAGATPWAFAVRANTPIRCDDLFNGRRAGCVVPDFIPTITTMNQLRFISQSIRSLQGKGAPKVLHRNSYLDDINRRALCGRAKLPAEWRPPKGWPLPLSNEENKPSCDEYPFATTAEGGNGPRNGYAWVPQRENDSQGALLKNFYFDNRVLNATSILQSGDAFRVTV
ncbi:NucA/NucB deoxyribonuclease domain-containing protein [Streptacidiphilus sp. MAP12-33]|uniref:NucA/NucB deoxyribonuclease domain-containing protein n=1 Tax=Streptacidiphilus sp. MAP12-33 TaxID=3156266 RepID=UPI003511473C